MTADDEKRFLDQVRRELDRHAEALDEVTAARLRAARLRALQTRPRARWLPAAGLATAAAVVLALVIGYRLPFGEPALPGEWDTLAASEELELIDELEFYAWLEETQPSS